MKYKVQLPPMPKDRTKFPTNGPGGTGLAAYVLEHDGEYIQCVCDNWPFPEFAFSRGFADSPIKNHPATAWQVAASPTRGHLGADARERDVLFGEGGVLSLPLVED